MILLDHQVLCNLNWFWATSCVEGVDCLKITGDKSSDSRVYTSDVGIIKVVHTMPRRRAWSPRLNITTMPTRRNKSPHLSTTSVLRHKAWSPRLTREARFRVRSSHFNTTAGPKREAQDPRLRREAWHIVWSSRFNTTAAPKRGAQDSRPALPQRLNAGLKSVFQLQSGLASHL